MPDTVSAVEQEYWVHLASGLLPLQHCGACGSVTHPPRLRCPDCYSSDWEYEAATGRGQVYGYTGIYRPSEPQYRTETPITSVIVELAEGPRVMGVYEGPIDDISVGAEVELISSVLSADDVRLRFETVE